MTQTCPPLEANDLSKAYSGRMVVARVSVAVHRSECIAVIGANGSGKTTLLRCLAGASVPTSGRVLWYQQSMAACRGARRQVGFVAHESRLYAHLTARQNLVFAARMNDLPDPHRQADVWLERSGLGSYGGGLPGDLSRGLQRRLAIARALIHSPDILLLDEPLAGLDDAGEAWLTELIGKLCRDGACCCIATHHLGRWMSTATRVYQLRAGNLLECHEHGGRGVPAGIER